MMIGRRYYLSCLSLGLTFACLRSAVGQACDRLGFTDISSRTYRADLVLDATVRRVSEGRRRGEKTSVRFRVNDVLKGRLERGSNPEKYPTISVGMFSLRPNLERCVAPLPTVGSRYVLFLNSTKTSSKSGRNGGNSSSSDGAAATTDSTVFLISSFPLEFSDDVTDAVRQSSNSTYWKRPRLKMRSNESLHLHPGTKLRLQCVANGRPKPKVLWYNNETLLHRTKHVTFSDTKRGSTLFIRNVTLADAGIYRCQAINVLGRTSLNSTNGISVRVAESSSHSVPCKRQGYCLNGGMCMVVVALQNRRHCRCDAAFIGERCEEKVTGIPNVVMGKDFRRKF